MPKPPPTLFHPKKKQRPTGYSGVNGLPRVQQSPGPPPSASGKASDDEEDTLDLPQGNFSEFRLMSCPRNGWKYDVMKFDSRNKVVDISTWAPPIKLNRKEVKRAEDKVEVVGIKPMLGADGKPVLDQFGNQVMVDKEGLPVHVNADGSVKGKEKEKDPKKGFKGKAKRIKQVFLTDEATRLMRKEERYPWVIEDATGKEVWTASMEETSKSDVYAFFMPAANNIFNFVPAHRWYKFHKKPAHYVPTLEEAEKVLDRIKKNKDPQTWLLRNKASGVSNATLATLKSEEASPGPSLGPGGRRLRAVDKGTDLFGDDEDDKEAVRRRARELGEEGHLDEMEYEEDFADDEENVDMDEKLDEEAKELEERMKREYKSANKQREGYVDESDDEDDESKLTKEGRRMKKLIQNVEKNDAYDSDQEENPYASSAEEEEEEDDLPTAPPDPATKPGASQPESAVKKEPSQQPNASRANSPTSPSLGGHSVVAKRATSPKMSNKPKQNGASRASSPLAGGSRATSPNPPNNKRKAEDSPPSNGMKKRKSGPPGELTEELFVQWLSVTPNATTKDCIKHFTPYLADDVARAKLKHLVTSIAILNEKKVLVFKPPKPDTEPKSPAV